VSHIVFDEHSELFDLDRFTECRISCFNLPDSDHADSLAFSANGFNTHCLPACLPAFRCFAKSRIAMQCDAMPHRDSSR
jgi:hypothetical protein